MLNPTMHSNILKALKSPLIWQVFAMVSNLFDHRIPPSPPPLCYVNILGKHS